MRITVGGVLFIGGSAAFVALGPLNSLAPIDEIKHSLNFITGYFHSEPVETAPVSVEKPVDSNPTRKESASVDTSTLESSQPKPPTVPEKPATAENAAAPAPTPLSVANPVASPTLKKARGHRRVPKLGEQPVQLALTKRPPHSKELRRKKSVGSEDKLLGSYVSLKLNSGRDVKGILKSRDEHEYIIELPGMGPFKYPASNVTAVTPVE